MTRCDPKVPAESTFGYHAILSSFCEAETTSVSPSPSMSAAKTDRAPSAASVMICWGPKLPSPSRFSYQAILSSLFDAERTSRSRSPSRSAANTPCAPKAAMEMIRSGPNVPAPSVFSYQAILLSSRDAESTSRSPSLSRSAAIANCAPSAAEVMTCAAPNVPSPSVFSYQTTVSSPTEVANTSPSPSPSRSAATTDWAAVRPSSIGCNGPNAPSPLVFSCHAIVSTSAEAESASRSPSPSISAAKTDQAEWVELTIGGCTVKGTAESIARSSSDSSASILGAGVRCPDCLREVCPQCRKLCRKLPNGSFMASIPNCALRHHRQRAASNHLPVQPCAGKKRAGIVRLREPPRKASRAGRGGPGGPC